MIKNPTEVYHAVSISLSLRVSINIGLEPMHRVHKTARENWQPVNLSYFNSNQITTRHQPTGAAWAFPLPLWKCPEVKTRTFIKHKQWQIYPFKAHQVEEEISVQTFSASSLQECRCFGTTGDNGPQWAEALIKMCPHKQSKQAQIQILQNENLSSTVFSLNSLNFCTQ